ncbi:MAG: hypothetical protein HY319_22340 [Armatimonadetes bacterium]|nr:hypothetical protein [Armatimonadota bacterium]
MSERKYENIYTQEMERALEAQTGHRQQETAKMADLAARQATLSTVLRWLTGGAGLAVVGAGLYLITSDPAAGPLVMAMVATFLALAFILYLVNRK